MLIAVLFWGNFLFPLLSHVVCLWSVLLPCLSEVIFRLLFSCYDAVGFCFSSEEKYQHLERSPLNKLRQKYISNSCFPLEFCDEASRTKPSSRRRNIKQSSPQTNLKDIPLQCTNVCASCPNPVPDAAAFISFSDLLCFQTGAPHLLISRQPELLNAPSRPRFVWNSSPYHRRFTGARGISKSDTELLESE